MNSDRITIRNGFGKIMGFIETDMYGRKVAKDFSFRILGWYDPSTNITRTFEGKWVSQGDTVVSLIPNDSIYWGECMIKVYTKEGCPKCKVLKMKLHQKNIEFDESNNLQEVQNLGLTELPVMVVDGSVYRFKQAVEYVNSLWGIK